MRLLISSLPFLSLAAGTLNRRDAASIQNILTGITNQINAVDTIVTAYTGGSIDSLSAASKKLLDSITAGTASVKTSAPLNDNDATNIAMNVITLNSSTATVVNDLIAKKPVFDSQKPPVGGVVLQSLNDQLAASKDFAAALTALVPADVAPVAAALSADIAANLQRGIAAYADDAHQPPPPTSSGSGGSPPPPTGSASQPPPGSSGSATGSLPPKHSSTHGAPPPPTTTCTTGGSAPPHGNKTLSTTQTVPPATYTPGSGAERVSAIGGVVVGALALVPVLFL